MDKHGVEAASPLATIEDIQKRLTRPPSLHSPQPPSSAVASHLYELQHQNSSNVDKSPSQKRRKLTEKLRDNVRVRNQKLEDYFDLALLSSIRAKMNISMKKKVRTSIKVKSEFEEFVVWPAREDDSDVFSESSRRTDDEAIVDLKNDNEDSFGITVKKIRGIAWIRFNSLNLRHSFGSRDEAKRGKCGRVVSRWRQKVALFSKR